MIISTFFFSVMLLFSFPCLVASQIVWVILLLRSILSLTPMLILALFFYLKTYLRCTGPYRMKPNGSCVTSLFFGYQYAAQACLHKNHSSWVRKVLCVAKVHMSLGSLQGPAASAALAAWIPWCPSCRQVTGPMFLHQLETIFLPTLLLWIGTRNLYSMLCGASVSRSFLGKCQTFTYIESCICWAVRQ